MPKRRRLRLAGVFCALVAAVAWVQIRAGAFTADLSGPDESAHFVTGLLIRDYVAAGITRSPLAFAKDYYLHYPKVAFGVWPPLFHVIEAGWTLVFPATVPSVLALVGLGAVLLGFIVYRIGETTTSAAMALVAALIFVALPTTQLVTTRVLADVQVALFEWCAVVAWARYLERDRSRDAVWFGVWGSAAMLTKGNAMALLAVPVLTALIGADRRIRSRTFWAGIAIMVAVAGPWQLYSWTIVRSTVVLVPKPFEYVSLYLGMIADEVGWPIAVVALVELVLTVRAGLIGERPEPAALTFCALTVAVVGFHAFVPLTPSSRYVLGVMPAVLILACRGAIRAAAAAARHVPGVRAGLTTAALAAAAVVTVGAAALDVPAKDTYGYGEVTGWLFAGSAPQRHVILSSSSGNGDGMFISQVATRERRPDSVVVRADKVLSRSTWDGAEYELLKKTPAEVADFLDSVPIDVVVVDQEAEREVPPHQRLLLQALAARPADWRLVHVHQRESRASWIRVYASTREPRSAERRTITIDMTHSLGGSLSSVVSVSQPR